MISSVPERMTCRSGYSADEASRGSNRTVRRRSVIPPIMLLALSMPMRARCLDGGRTVLCDHADLMSHVVAESPVARCWLIPRCSLRQFKLLANRKRLVEKRNPAASQRRWAFHALRIAGAIETSLLH